MNNDRLSLLQYLYNKTEKGGFVSLYTLEVEFAMSGTRLLEYLEDLKEEEFVIESHEGFAISQKGILFSKTRWV
ncbi:MAG: hypothetical protein N2316_09625 [Spirochaetes bacterium]|nr:hypothetical protein [Spirochaetota bacterium]